MKILIINYSRVGDSILSTALIKHLLDEYPKYLSIIALVFMGGGAIIAVQHIWRLYKFKP